MGRRDGWTKMSDHGKKKRIWSNSEFYSHEMTVAINQRNGLEDEPIKKGHQRDALKYIIA